MFYGKGHCAECHKPPFFIDDQMHDLHLERFYTIETIAGQRNMQDGPIKTFTLRGIKDSPPYHHDGRLLTLDDTVEFFNLVLTLKLTKQEKSNLVAYLALLVANAETAGEDIIATPGSIRPGGSDHLLRASRLAFAADTLWTKSVGAC